jgi:hypothetical protein
MEVISMYDVDQYTVSLLHFDDGLKDECGNSWGGDDTVQYSSDVKAVGTKSILFNNPAARIYPNDYKNFSCLDINGTFSMDFWMYPQKVDNKPVVFGMKFNDSILNVFEINIMPNNILQFGTNFPPNGAWVTHDTTNLININEWNHIYMAITLDTIYIAINGKIETYPNDFSRYDKLTELSIGDRCKSLDEGYAFNGYIDEFRISNVVRWTSDFNPKVGKALLIVTMSDEIQKEYDLSTDEINSFITWYNNRSSGTGLPHYTFNKDFNLGPFQSRKEYLVFDKIQNFEVMEYTK